MSVSWCAGTAAPEGGLAHDVDITDIAPYDPAPAVERAEEQGGVMRGLAAALRSVAARRDGNVCVVETCDGRRVTVVAQSDGGCWTDRQWWLTATWVVTDDAHGKVCLSPEGEVVLATTSRDGADCTVFRERDDAFHHRLSRVLAQWHMGRLARAALRDLPSQTA